MIRSQSATVVFRNAPPMPIPALFTTTSGTPCSSRTRAANAVHASVSDTSRW